MEYRHSIRVFTIFYVHKASEFRGFEWYVFIVQKYF